MASLDMFPQGAIDYILENSEMATKAEQGYVNRHIAHERAESDFVPRAEFEELREQFFVLERTLYGIQQMLGKAAEYKGKPRGRLPR